MALDERADVAAVAKARGSPVPTPKWMRGTPRSATPANTFTEAGKVGLWTKADSVTYFDELVVSPLP